MKQDNEKPTGAFEPGTFGGGSNGCVVWILAPLIGLAMLAAGCGYGYPSPCSSGSESGVESSEGSGSSVKPKSDVEVDKEAGVQWTHFELKDGGLDVHRGVLDGDAIVEVRKESDSCCDETLSAVMAVAIMSPTEEIAKQNASVVMEIMNVVEEHKDGCNRCAAWLMSGGVEVDSSLELVPWTEEQREKLRSISQ